MHCTRHAIATVLIALSAGSLAAQDGRDAPPAPGGSGVPKLVGTSEEAFQASVQAVAKTLRPEQRKRFEYGLELIESLMPSRKHFVKSADGRTAKDVFQTLDRVLTRFDHNGNGKLDRAERRTLAKILERARKSANESAAVATLRNLSSAQAQFQATGFVDTDGNGTGEYAYFAELCGAVGLRTKDGKPGKPIDPKLFTTSEVEDGRFVRNGYVFQIYLPGKDGTPIPEASKGGVGATAPDAAAAENAWCAYAWPVEHDKTGTRTFFISHHGDVLSTSKRYSGTKDAPSPDAAFPDGVKSMTELKEGKRKGNDGSGWNPLF